MTGKRTQIYQSIRHLFEEILQLRPNILHWLYIYFSPANSFKHRDGGDIGIGKTEGDAIFIVVLSEPNHLKVLRLHCTKRIMNIFTTWS